MYNSAKKNNLITLSLCASRLIHHCASMIVLPLPSQTGKNFVNFEKSILESFFFFFFFVKFFFSTARLEHLFLLACERASQFKPKTQLKNRQLQLASCLLTIMRVFRGIFPLTLFSQLAEYLDWNTEEEGGGGMKGFFFPFLFFSFRFSFKFDAFNIFFFSFSFLLRSLHLKIVGVCGI